MSSLTKALYRELVGTTKLLDHHASLRAHLTMDLHDSCATSDTQSRLPHVEAFRRCLVHYLGGRHFYLPDPQRSTLLQLVRKEFRKNSEHATDGLDTAFVALRALNKTLAVTKHQTLPAKNNPETGTLYDDVHLAENVTPGVFLVAHPLLEGIFSRSVVFVTEHTPEGSKGFIVNKMLQKPLQRVFQVPSRVMRAFSTSTVRKGGPVFSKNAEVLHGRADFGGQRVQTTPFPSANDPSLFVGIDLDVAARAIYDGTAKQTDVVFMTGTSVWVPGQLESELNQGSWVPMKAPVSLALNAPAELWQDMMRTIGGEYAEMSGMPAIEVEE